MLDFHGTAPQAKGPINHCGDYADGNFLKKWLAPILRNLADTPERMAELDVNEGVVPLIEMRFPPQGHAAHPGVPGADQRPHVRDPAPARGARRRGRQGGRRADAGRPGDDPLHRRLRDDLDGAPYLMREVLGGGSGGRYYADGEDTIHVVPDSRNLPSEFSEARFPFVVERLGLAVDSGGAGRYRGGLGYEKHIRMLEDAHFMSIADRSILSCWGVKGGKAGRPFAVTIDPGGPSEREVDALADAEPVRAGEVIRIRTTGGGGWGDPLDAAVRRGRARRALGQGVAGGRPRRLRRGGAGRDDAPVVDEPPATRCAGRAAGRPAGRGVGAVLRPGPGLRHPGRRRHRGRRGLAVTTVGAWASR